MKNTTNNNIFTMFGTPARVIIDGTVATHSELIASYIKVMHENPDRIKALAISRIGGVVKVYITTKGRQHEVAENKQSRMAGNRKARLFRYRANGQIVLVAIHIGHAGV